MSLTTPSKVLGTRNDAAVRCGIAPRTYSLWVQKGIMPGPIQGTRRYDLDAIDLRLAAIRQTAPAQVADSPMPTESDFQRWLRENGHEG